MFAQIGRWKGLLKRAESWHVGRITAQARYQRFVRDHWERLPAPVVEVPAATNACLECRVAFAGCHAWSAHAARVHGYRSKSRRFAVGRRCQACGAIFPTHRQYQRHLQIYPRCCQAIEQGFEGLFPVFEEKDGHVQGTVVASVGSGQRYSLTSVLSCCSSCAQEFLTRQRASFRLSFRATSPSLP